MQQGNPYKYLPEIEFHTISVDEGLTKRNDDVYDEDEQFHINKMFATKGGKFINGDLVDEWLDMMAPRRIAKGQYSPFTFIKAHTKMLDHSLWMLSRVDSAKALAKKLKAHPYWSQFAVINVSGSEITDLRLVKKTIALNDKTITLSVGRFTTGVTIKEWGSVWFLNGGASPMAYYQTAFRSQSIWKWTDPDGNEDYKKKCYVIDFNPSRLLEMIWKQQASLVGDLSQVEQAVTDWLETAPLYQHGAIETKKIETEDVLDISFSAKNLVDKFASGYAIDTLRANDDIISALLDVDPSAAAAFSKQITDAVKNAGKQKTKEQSSNDKKEDKEIKKKIDQLRERAQTVMKRLPSYLYVSEYNEESYNDIVKYAEPNTFKEETEVSIDDFKVMVDTGFINRAHVDYCTKAFQVIENNIEPLI